MLRIVDSIASTNRWRNHSDAVALLCFGLLLETLLLPPFTVSPLVLVTCFGLAIGGAQVPGWIFCRAMFLSLAFIALSSLGIAWSLEFYPRYDLHFNQAEGMRALQIGLRAWAATSVTLLFAFTTSIAQVSNLLRRIRVPSGLVELIGLTYYSLFRLDDSLEKLLTAQRQRLGYRNFTLSLRSTGHAISALFLRSVRQSIRWERGLTARGYHGQLRVLLPPSETRFYHHLAALGVVLGILVLTTLGRI